ncbi:hypothetical protein VSS74_28035 [Conexibacter stalactiti]|uniref:Secreted protein n=1 Tax=Conexibacter stalactiti TaxID=1940611 RepID=A0ABU4HY39_9ACTN|nr:hypothetical protein [Conexibacter stalactiti]MDW5598240.1 hypothetical protein [Conexibacter stalactiti]MEC5038882.1 hypothetical protein [Conexibacter stalactiti]
MPLRLTRAALGALTVLTVLLLPAAGARAEGQSTITLDDSRLITIDGAQSDGYGYIRTTVKVYRPTEFILVRLKPGKDSGYFANLAYKLSPQKLTTWGTLVLSGTARPGAPYVATTSLTPGWHALVVRGRDPYVAGGFTVSSEPDGGSRPEPAAIVRLGDGALTAPAKLTAGSLLEVVNDGGQVHDLRIGRVAAGQSPATAAKLLKAGRGGEVRWSGSPRTLVGWTSPRVAQFIAPRLAAGRYLLVSGRPDGSALTRVVTVS